MLGSSRLHDVTCEAHSMEKERHQDTGKATDLLCFSSARTMVSAVILCIFITALAQEPDLKHAADLFNRHAPKRARASTP